MEGTTIEVPSFFLCPISLEMMKDPVTLPTGISYERKSIEKWLSSGKNDTCPVTKQPIPNCDLTPNHTLHRLIQSWCNLNSSMLIQRLPTQRPPVNKFQIDILISEAESPFQLIKCLRKLRSIADESDVNKRTMEDNGVVEFLASIINNKFDNNKFDSTTGINEDELGFDITKPIDEALSLLYNLKVCDSHLKRLVMANENEFVESMIRIMQHGKYESRAYAVMMLKLLVEVSEPSNLINLPCRFFVEIVQVLRDQISQKASKATLQLLIILCPLGKNRIKFVEAGAVSILIDLLLDSTPSTSERRRCELTLSVLHLLCQCAEGRAELLKHEAGLAIVSKKILRVSHAANEKAMKILDSISKFSGSSSVVQEMLEYGIVAKLCLVIQMDCGKKIKETAREILRLHARFWKNSTCIPINLLASYPA